MRIEGTLKKWNDERGFGFIQPTHGGQEVFVHISSFPRSQMTSCAEATFFLKSCPGVKMDGDHDGVPCEAQWCTGPFSQ